MEQSTKLEMLKGLAAKGKVSRRDFMQFAIAAGITAAAADRMFVTAARAEPKKGGTIKIGLGHGATTDTLDPGLYPDQFTGTALWGTLANSLTEVDAKGNITPDLAESFEPADGAKKWVFKLRKGSTFHNGKPVTAADVVASIEHHRGENSKSAAKALLTSIKSIKADGDNTVIFELDGGNADFPFTVSDYHLPIMPRNDDGSVDWQSGIRTGAYTLEKFEPGVSATFNKNPNYYKSDKGWFDRVEFVAIKDVTARINALLSGELHYMDRCDPKSLDLLKANSNLTVQEITGYGHQIFVMNVQQKPFDDVNVRLALKHSVNREQILENVFLGHGTVGNDNPIAPTVKFAIDPQPRHSYDPEKAKAFLKKAGLDSLKVDLSVAEAAFSGAVDSALLWKESAKACGIDLNVIREPDDGYWDNVWLKKPFVASYWSGRPTVDWMMTTAYAAEASWNDTFWKNPRFNELLVAARSETDEAKRAAMYAEMQQLVHDDGGLVNLVFNSYLEAHVNNLGHGDVAANWQLDGMKIAERWWFNS
ncbi:MAG: ABC transporter substrate-binding protein [Aestuariivirga sp.]